MFLCSLLVALAAALITFALGVDLVEALLGLLAPVVEAPTVEAPTVTRQPRQPLPPMGGAPVRRRVAPFTPAPAHAGFTVLPA